MTTRVTTNKTKPKYSCLKCGKTSQDVHNYEYLIRLYPVPVTKNVLTKLELRDQARTTQTFNI